MENNQVNTYGFGNDEQKVSPFRFGLNANTAFLTKFEWIPNGGSDGAEQEALDIVFNINGVDKGARLYPVTKAFVKGGGETTDMNSPEMKEAFATLNAIVTHILHCFVDLETIKAKFSTRITSFKQFATIAMSILPQDFSKKPLDVFLQYQYNLKDGQQRTYLELPKSMKYGKFLAAADTSAKWKEVRMDNPGERDTNALYYVDEVSGKKHPFERNGWYMTNNFSKLQKVDEVSAAPIANASTGPQEVW